MDIQGKTKRNINVEVLRCLLMLAIVMHHIIVHGFGLKTLAQGEYIVGENSFVLVMLDAFLIPAVNCFILISGYYGINYSKKKIFKLLYKVLMCAIIGCLLWIIFGGPVQTIWKFFYYITRYWFVNAYLLIVLLSGVINNCLSALSNKSFSRFIIIAVVIDSVLVYVIGATEFGSQAGYSFNHLLVMYCIGAYIRKNDGKIKQTKILSKIGIGGYVACSLIIGGICLALVQQSQQLAYKAYSYNNPVVMLSAICLFVFFAYAKENVANEEHMGIRNIVLTISVHMLDVYLISEFMPLREIIYRPIVKSTITNNNILLIFGIMGYALCLLLFFALMGNLSEKVAFEGFKLSGYPFV